MKAFEPILAVIVSVSMFCCITLIGSYVLSMGKAHTKLRRDFIIFAVFMLLCLCLGGLIDGRILL